MFLLFKSILIALITYNSHTHPVHVSVINVDYFVDNNEISISIKTNKEDIQLLFAHMYQMNIDVGKDSNYVLYGDKVNAYINDHFKIYYKAEELKLTSDGIKQDKESIWFSYSVLVNKTLGEIKIKNTILLDLHLNQKSLMIVRCKNTEKGYQFDLRKKEYIIDFDDY